MTHDWEELQRPFGTIWVCSRCDSISSTDGLPNGRRPSADSAVQLRLACPLSPDASCDELLVYLVLSS